MNPSPTVTLHFTQPNKSKQTIHLTVTEEELTFFRAVDYIKFEGVNWQVDDTDLNAEVKLPTPGEGTEIRISRQVELTLIKSKRWDDE
jgi:hypothetical protein